MEKPQAFRFHYRQPGAFGWKYLCSSLNTKEGASELVSKWNRRDREKWHWRMEECLPTDFDYPLQAERS